jgi:hypothetical protein
MMPRIISRRSLVATAISGAVAWLGGYLSFPAAHAGCKFPIAGYGELIVLCLGLRCPRTIGKACLLALAVPENARAPLARTILADVRSVDLSLPELLARAIRERSRADFCEGRVVTVDGWILSLPETRVYALAALLSEPRIPVA